MKHNNQVHDNKKLLDKMMEDLQGADELYKPTNYWSFYQKSILPELKRKGLKDFRRRKSSLLTSFGATDLFLFALPKYEGRQYIRGLDRMLRMCTYILNKLRIKLSINYPVAEITSYFFEYVKKKYENKSLNIFCCPTSFYGNPEDVKVIEKTPWSLEHLRVASMFIDTVPDIKFSNSMVFCELGPGLGRNIEILAKLYERATFLMFDIPPQLYVSSQYLSAVFKDRVLGYEASSSIFPDKNGNIPDCAKGKIIVMPTWSMPVWSNTKIDIFWNSASFQEMEPHVVKNYLDLVKKMRPDFIYINALPEGNYWGEWKPGLGGTKEAVLEKYYLGFLEDKYSLLKKYYTDNLLRENKYMSYILSNR